MRDLNYQLKMLCKHSHEGSFETRVGRERQLSAIANQLHDLGFRQMKATSLKQKHVQALVDHWLDQNLSPGTIKNRMSCLRWWAAFEHIEARNRADNVRAFDALLNQGVEPVALTDAEKQAWLAMQQPGEAMMQSEGGLSTAALERIKALVRDFRQQQ